MTPQDNNFTVTGSKAVGDVDLPLAELIDICLAENDAGSAATTRACCGRRSCRAWCASPAALCARRAKRAAAACMKIGTDEHKRRFCHQFIASHDRFDPEALPWPELDEAALERLRAMPFWQEVLHTERRAGAIVEAFAATIDDPLVREAVMLQGVRGGAPRRVCCG